MHSCKANGPWGKQVGKPRRCLRENNSVRGSKGCFFIEYLLCLVLLLLGNSSAGQIAYKPVKGQKVMVQISLKENQILLQKKKTITRAKRCDLTNILGDDIRGSFANEEKNCSQRLKTPPDNRT